MPALPAYRPFGNSLRRVLNPLQPLSETSSITSYITTSARNTTIKSTPHVAYVIKQKENYHTWPKPRSSYPEISIEPAPLSLEDHFMVPISAIRNGPRAWKCQTR